jgi:transposase InsO family protein
MHEIAATRIRYGCDRIYTLLRREGWKDNHKRVHRLYKQEGLDLRAKRPKRIKSAAHRMDRIAFTHKNQCWSMDFVADQLFDGRKFRALLSLTIIRVNAWESLPDNRSRENRLQILLTTLKQRTEECHREYKYTMAVNSSQKHWTNGPMIITLC